MPVPLPLAGTSSVPGGGATGAITTILITDPWEAVEPHYQGVLRTGPSMSLFDLPVLAAELALRDSLPVCPLRRSADLSR